MAGSRLFGRKSSPAGLQAFSAAVTRSPASDCDGLICWLGDRMKNMRHRNDCRLCGSTDLECVLPIRRSAIGDAFIAADQLSDVQETYPLDTYLCLKCGHLQNLDIVDPEVLFKHYTYHTSSSLGLVEHFKRYAASVVATLGLPEGSLVVEIGSNDGSLLKAFQTFGLKVIGVDPAENIAAEATAAGVPTVADFFSSAVAKKIRGERGPAALVCANNVFAHADNLADIVEGIHGVLAPDGVFVFEVSYVPDIIDNFVFDTIYHEHVSHHALIPLERFFATLDMTLFDVERISSKGGSIRGFAQKLSAGLRSRTPRLHQLMANEELRGIARPEIYKRFYEAIELRKQATLQYLDQALASGKLVAGYGASTTTTTLLYHFELGPRLSFIVDDNPAKQGLYSPGYHLPVYPSSDLLKRRPDVVVIAAWTYADTIIDRNREFLNGGGHFLVPLPELRVV
jgi:SAM-dependent methyltransferase